ncbi:MAG: c-type cytochrome [Candidatus Tectomicrobia bacterium]|nr:c-type cytochrome [Candidatus Tectomicrobia bacterium]
MPPVEQSSKARFFFVVSMLLLASIAWVVWDEIEGRRPWKDYQREFDRLEAQRVRKEIAAERKKVSDELARLNAAIEKARRETAASEPYAAAQRRLADIQDRLDKASLENKFARSEMDEAYYEYKHALQNGRPATAEKARYERLEASTVRLGKAEADLTEQEKAARQEIERLGRSLKQLEEKKTQTGRDLGGLERRLASIERRVPAIQQVVIEGVEFNNFGQAVLTVDRCQTCHLAADRPGFEDFPPPFRTHPKRDVLLRKHPVEKFGCSLCHGGQGQALNSLTKAHGLDLKTGEHLEFWEKPLLRGESAQTNCLRCHAATLDVPMASVVSKGRRLFTELGCSGCHLMQGYEDLPKVGPSLLKASQKFNPGWMVSWVLNPREHLPATRMPFFSFTREQATALTAYLLKASEGVPPSGPLKYNPGPDAEAAARRGKTLFESRGCLACHAIDGKGGAFGPDLGRVGAKVNADWVVNWVKDPKRYDPGTAMPDLRLSDAEAQDLAAYLLSRGKPAPARPEIIAQLKDPAAIQEGRRLVENYGCYGCHNIQGTEKIGRLSVELTTFANKKPAELDFGDVTQIPETWDAWLFAKLKNPRIFSTDRISLRMPNFYLTDEEVKALMTFLQRADGHEMAGEFVRKLSPREAALERGRRLVEKYNCAGCHVIEGKGGDIRPFYKDPSLAPPVLAGEGAKVQPGWLFGFLKRPVPLRPWLAVRMPTFGLTDEEAAALVSYFSAQVEKEMGSPYLFVDDGAIDRGNVAVGKFLFQTFQCLECHQQATGKEAADLAPDLFLARERLRPGWIVSWLKDPQKIQEGTRMPTFFSGDESPLTTVWKGNAEKQIRALRDYLLRFDGGKGEAKGIPEGVITEEEEKKEEKKKKE